MSELEKRWAVLLDDQTDATFESRAKARDHAAWLRRHPAAVDRARFGHGGIVQILDRRKEAN